MRPLRLHRSGLIFYKHNFFHNYPLYLYTMIMLKETFTIHRWFGVVLGAVLITLAACNPTGGNQPSDSRHDGPRGGMMMDNKADDSVFIALKNETLGKFQQLTFSDPQTGKEMNYSLFVPEGAAESGSLPLLMYIADMSSAGKEATAALTKNYGPLLFASDRDQQKHPCLILVPQFSAPAVNDKWETTDEVEITVRLLEDVLKRYPQVDTKRLYTTGQSMGGMISFYLNIAHPDLFAASLYVSCQWDTEKMKDFGGRKFFYIVAGGDEHASGGMRDLSAVLEKQNARVERATWSARLSQQEQDSLAQALIDRGCNINLITFEKGTVLPESGQGMEHMASFDFAYKLTPVRDWLFEQVSAPSPKRK